MNPYSSPSKDCEPPKEPSQPGSITPLQVLAISLLAFNFGLVAAELLDSFYSDRAMFRLSIRLGLNLFFMVLFAVIHIPICIYLHGALRLHLVVSSGVCAFLLVILFRNALVLQEYFKMSNGITGIACFAVPLCVSVSVLFMLR